MSKVLKKNKNNLRLYLRFGYSNSFAFKSDNEGFLSRFKNVKYCEDAVFKVGETNDKKEIFIVKKQLIII